ncbi:MAG: hypothetical protein JWM59_4102 [Verrucomicrobiales bacterium]|nr:hypothetical protein [Verrucomicrobiales bacterium]
MDAVQRIYHSMGLDQLKERKHHHDKAVEAREALTVDLSKAEERLALGKSRGIAPVILACWGDEIRKLKQRLAAA